jgi:D-ornithine 4,5-aminomutase subunit alpha
MTGIDEHFAERRAALAHLSADELRQRFWSAAREVVSPLVEMARTHTTPSIERSVLMRMGATSLEAQAIVERCLDIGLMGKGAGHVVLRVAQITASDPAEALRRLGRGEGWEAAALAFNCPPLRGEGPGTRVSGMHDTQ